MKSFIGILLGLLLSFPVLSQESGSDEKKQSGNDEIKTVFGKKDHPSRIQLGYFIEMNGAYTKFGNKDIFLPGINAGMILNHNWTIGAGGQLVMGHQVKYSDFYYNETYGEWRDAQLMGGFGGLLLEYTLLPRSVVHVSFPLTIGGGYLSYADYDEVMDQNNNFHNGNHTTVDYDYFFMVEPGVRLEFNMVKYFRIGLGVSYRYTPDLNLSNTSAAFINQFTAKLNIRFGKF